MYERQRKGSSALQYLLFPKVVDLRATVLQPCYCISVILFKRTFCCPNRAVQYDLIHHYPYKLCYSISPYVFLGHCDILRT